MRHVVLPTRGRRCSRQTVLLLALALLAPATAFAQISEPLHFGVGGGVFSSCQAADAAGWRWQGYRSPGLAGPKDIRTHLGGLFLISPGVPLLAFGSRHSGAGLRPVR